MTSREERCRRAAEIAENCRQKGYHCSESTLRAAAQVLGVPISEELLRVSSVFRGGGGGYGGRCGVAEAGLMMIGLLYGRSDESGDSEAYSYLARLWLKRFRLHFVSLNCADLLPATKERSPENNCARTYTEGAELMVDFLLDAPELLEKRAALQRSKASE